MTDAASNPIPSQPGKTASPGLPLSMTHAELVIAITHIHDKWWPQICRSSRERIADIGVFEEGWFDDDGMLDILNPAFWKIINAMGHLYSKIHTRYQDDVAKKFRVRWQVARDEDTVYLLAEGKPPLTGNGTAKGPAKGFRIKGPRAGWVDFQMEIDVLRAMRDAADPGVEPEDAAVAPTMHVAGDGTLVHSSTSGPAGGPAFSLAQRKDIAEQVKDALEEEVSHSRAPATEEDQQTAAKVSKWIEGQSSCRGHPDVQPDTVAADGTATEEEVVGSTREESTMSIAHVNVDASAAVPDIEDDTDSLDKDWVKVGEGDEADEFTVPVATDYQYKREDAKVARKGWFGRVYYDYV